MRKKFRIVQLTTGEYMAESKNNLFSPWVPLGISKSFLDIKNIINLYVKEAQSGKMNQKKAYRLIELIEV